MFAILLGRQKENWAFSAAEGTAGGMLICWKSDLFKVRAIESGLYSLSVKLFNQDSGFSCWLSCIYGPSKQKQRGILD